MYFWSRMLILIYDQLNHFFWSLLMFFLIQPGMGATPTLLTNGLLLIFFWSLINIFLISAWHVFCWSLKMFFLILLPGTQGYPIFARAHLTSWWIYQIILGLISFSSFVSNITSSVCSPRNVQWRRLAGAQHDSLQVGLIRDGLKLETDLGWNWEPTQRPAEMTQLRNLNSPSLSHISSPRVWSGLACEQSDGVLVQQNGEYVLSRAGDFFEVSLADCLVQF
jgi:hypothetical protein